MGYNIRMPGSKAFRRPPLCVLLANAWVVATLGSPGFGADVRVDFSQLVGTIRPLHGVNCGPLPAGGLTDLSDLHRAAAFPFVRLHDCRWPNTDVVDIHVVFPDFRRDPADPASYDFARTDAYVKAVLDTGSKVVFRLGESIEHTADKRHVHPPADVAKWAAVCLGIVRHYNDGWANGFRHDIRYWEIWNEPENRPACWTGTDEQYFNLYEAASTAIKAKFPDLKVGGPAVGYSGKFAGGKLDGKFEPSEFVVAFLKRCRDRRLPLDFFSWHLYTDDPTECVARAKAIRALLDASGFPKAESHLNEWNYLPDNSWTPAGRKGQGPPRDQFFDRVGNAEGAAFAAAVLCNLQDAPVDVANYFRAETDAFGLFTSHGSPRKSYHAFRAFRQLLGNPRRVTTRIDDGAAGRGFAACAGVAEDGRSAAVLVGCLRPSDQPTTVRVAGLPWEGATACEVLVVDAARDLTAERRSVEPAGAFAVTLAADGPRVYLLSLSRAAGK